jgi:transposase
MSQAQAVRTFHVSRRPVHSWVKAYEAGGAAALKTKGMGRPKRSRLAGHQAAWVVNRITDRTPDQTRLPYALWTRDADRELLAERFGNHVSVWTVGRYLRGWGFTPQKPLRRAYERDPEAVRRWMEEEYPRIQVRARRENAEIHWGDEMGLRSNHHTGTSFAPRGRTPAIPGTGRRFGCNMISTTTHRDWLRFMVFTGTFTATVMV